MEKILVSFSENLVVSIILFLVIFGVIIFFFAKDKTSDFFVGFGRVLGSFFTSPFVFLRQSIYHLSDYGKRGESLFENTNQYLLLKIHTALKLFTIIIGVAILASGLVTSCNVFLPPSSLTDRIDNIDEKVDNLEEKMEDLEDRKEELDEMWEENKSSVISNHKNEIRNNINTAKTNFNNLKSELTSKDFLQNQLGYLNNFMQRDYVKKDDVNKAVNRMRNYINYQYLDDDIKEKLLDYINYWYSLNLDQITLSFFNEEDFRNEIQPNYSRLVTDLENTKVYLEQNLGQLESLESQASYNYGPFFLTIITTILLFLAVIWIIGIVLESLLLAIDLASNVGHIEHSLKAKESKTEEGNTNEK